MNPQDPNNPNPYGGQPQQPQQPVTQQPVAQPQQYQQVITPEQYYANQPIKRNRLPMIILIVVALLLLIVLPGIVLLFGGGEDTGTSTPTEQQITARKNDQARLAAAITTFSSNNNGVAPTTEQIQNDVIPNYIGEDFTDPISGEAYVIIGAPPIQQIYEIQYASPGYCVTEGSISSDGTSNRQFALLIQVGEVQYACVDNS